MINRSAITRAEMVAHASRLASDGGDLPFWSDNEYVRGMCELIADATGSSDPGSAKSEVWDEMRAVQILDTQRQRARKIAADVMDQVCMDDLSEIVDLSQILDVASRAALAGLQEGAM